MSYTELKHLCALDSSVNEVFKTRYKRPTADHKRDLLYKELARSLCREVDSIVSNFDNLLDNISRSVVNASQRLEHLRETNPPSTTQSEDTEETRPPQPAAGKPVSILPPPVRVLDLTFSDINYEAIKSSIDFTDKLPGGRETAYYGSVPYSYGNITHPPAEYPSLASLDTIFEQMKTIVPDFSTKNYTCLANHYPNGRVIEL